MYIHKILKKFLEHDLYIKLEKYQFHVQEIEFLDYIFSFNDISISKEHIATILDWLILKSVHDIQVFLEFANFFRHFIEGYSRIITSIKYELFSVHLKSNVPGRIKISQGIQTTLYLRQRH